MSRSLIAYYFSEISMTDALKLYAMDNLLNPIDRIYLYDKLLSDSILTADVKKDILVAVRSLKRSIDDRADEEALDHFDSIFRMPNKRLSFYQKTHNVHIISGSTVANANRFIELYRSTYTGRPYDHVFFDTIESCPTYNDDSLNILDLFAAIYRFIEESAYKTDLHRRLKEEMDDAVGTCLTGHVCRLFNVLRGYVDNDLDVVIENDYDLYRTKIFSNLTKVVNVYDDRAKLLVDIKSIVNENLIDINDNFILSVLNEYTGEEWYRHNGRYDFE